MKEAAEKLEKLKTELKILTLDVQKNSESVMNLAKIIEEKNSELSELLKHIESWKVQLSEELTTEKIMETTRLVAHDLAQPLTIMMGRCELLEMQLKNEPELIRHVDPILACARNMNELIQKLRNIKTDGAARENPTPPNT